MVIGEIKLLIFDLDGVLIDSREYWANVVYDTLQKFGYNISYENVEKSLGPKMKELLVQLCGSNAPIQEMLEYAGKLASDSSYLIKVKIVKEAKENLKKLRSRYKFALITNAPYPFVEYILRKADLLRFFDEIITASENFKTKADAIKFISEIMKTPLTQIAHIGDMVKDIEEARKVGCKAIAIPGWNSYEELERAKPDLIVNSLEELAKKL